MTYPFTDYFLNAVKGDYVNVDVKFDLDLSVLLENLENASTPVIPIPGAGPRRQAPPGGRRAAAAGADPARRRRTPCIVGGLAGLLGSLLGGGR